jgi:L-2,4-diaminobutyrate decarboxylase
MTQSQVDPSALPSAESGEAPVGFAEILLELDRDATGDAGSQFSALVARYLSAAYGAVGPVSTARTSSELSSRFDEPLPRVGAPLAQVLERLDTQVLGDLNRLAHPMAMGHQVSPPLPAAIWTDAIISAANQSIAVWEMSPSLTPIETRVIRWMADLAGFGAGAGGTFTSGGTEATFTALLAARAAACPDAWQLGLGAEPPLVMCNEHAHYAVMRAVGELGLGVRNAVPIPSRDYRMDPAALDGALREARAADRRVMAVVATAGSTATGSFDDLEVIASLCEREGAWLHVDAAHGGSALFSAAHRRRLRGLERAHSVAWDAHKMMLMPLPAGMLLVRDERALERAFAQSAPYLFHAGDGERIVDQGVRSFMCSRRGDALKVWVALQRYGANAFGALYDRLCDAARTVYAQVSARGDFEALHEPESNILCFRSTCDSMPDDPDERNVRTQRARERYNRSGEGWITTTIVDGERVFRVTVMNPRTGPEHTGRMLDGLAGEVRRSAVG